MRSRLLLEVLDELVGGDPQRAGLVELGLPQGATQRPGGVGQHDGLPVVRGVAEVGERDGDPLGGELLDADLHRAGVVLAVEEPVLSQVVEAQVLQAGLGVVEVVDEVAGRPGRPATLSRLPRRVSSQPRITPSIAAAAGGRWVVRVPG